MAQETQQLSWPENSLLGNVQNIMSSFNNGNTMDKQNQGNPSQRSHKNRSKRMKTRQSPNETGSPLSSEDSTSIINHDPASFYSTSNPARVSKSTAEPQTTETSSSNENISNISISTTPTGCYSSPKDVISKKSMVMKSFPAFGASSTSLPVPVLPSSFIQNNQKTPETGIDGKKNSFSILFYSSWE